MCVAACTPVCVSVLVCVYVCVSMWRLSVWMYMEVCVSVREETRRKLNQKSTLEGLRLKEESKDQVT